MAREGGKDRGLFERPKDSGVWWVRYYDAEHNERREKAGSKAQARLLYVKRKAEALTGKKLPELNKRPVVEWGFRKAVQTQLLEARGRAKAWKDQERIGELWLKVFQDTSLDDISPRAIEEWKIERSDEVAKKTVNNELAFLRRVFNVAIRDGWTGQNPLTKVKFWKINNARERQLEADEEARLRKELTPVDWIVVELLVHLGLRRGELFGLGRHDVDLRRSVVRMPDPKGGEARFVQINSRAKELFKQQLASHDSMWVFPSKNGLTPVRGDNWYHRAWRPALDRARIVNLRIHDLRHTFCSRLVQRGVNLRTVQKLAGHKSFATTERYAHLSPTHLRDAVEILVEGNAVPAQPAGQRPTTTKRAKTRQAANE